MKIYKKIILSMWYVIQTFLWLIASQLLLGMAIAFIIGLILGLLNVSINFTNLEGNEIFLLISTVLPILVLHFVYHKKEPDLIPFEKERAFSKYCNGFFAGAATFILIWLISVLLGGYQIQFVFTTSSIMMLVLYLIGYMIQGMSEEVLVRGFLFNRLKKQIDYRIAIIISSIFFAALHLGNSGINLPSFISLILFGIFTAIIQHYTHSLWFIGAFHSAWNYFQGPILGIPVSGNVNLPLFIISKLNSSYDLLTGGSFGLEASLITLIILSILCMIAWTKRDYLNSIS